MRSLSWPVVGLGLAVILGCESNGLGDPNMAYQRLSLAQKAIEVGVDETEQLTLDSSPVSGTINWQSTNPTVATVSNGGVVTARSIGVAKIVAAYSRSSDTATVTVHAPITKLLVNPDSATVMVGQSLRLAFSAYDKNGKTISGLTGSSSKWSSGDPSVATVSTAGVVQGVGMGVTSISVTISGRTAIAYLRVSRVPVDSVIVSPSPSASVAVGGAFKFTAAAVDSTGKPLSDWIVGWSSSDSSVATVSETGAVSTYKVGSATITASAGGKKAQTNLITNPAIVAAVAIAVNASTIQVGQSTQAVATAYDASGNQITGRPVAWATTKASVATVSSLGMIAGLDTGKTTISATVDGIVGSMTETVGGATIANLSVVLDKSTMPVGSTAQAKAVATDAAGNVLTGRTVTWSSSSTSIATVSSLGVVTAVGTGTVSITGTVDGMNSSATLVATSAVVASVSVTAASTSLTLGQTTQATAVLKDASGNTVTAPVTWSSSAPAVATVSSSGLITGMSAGSATITATSGTVSGTLPMPVGQSTTNSPSPTGFTAPELPRNFVDSKFVAPTGSTINVPPGGDIQAAINSAKPGDEIVLQAGATYNGNYFLTVKSGGDATHWITIRTSNMSGLPPAGSRVSPANASAMATVVSVDPSAPVFATMPGASYYRLVGIEATMPSSATMAYILVRLGDSGPPQDDLSEVPHHIVLDRMYVHGTDVANVQRCIALNSAWSAVVDSYISKCHAKGYDAQAIVGWNGPGPLKVVDNYLEGSGENILFGGADPSIANLNPGDIEIRRNYIVKPLSWKGVWTAKNLFELKNAVRVLFEGNVLENSWTDAQVGQGIVMQALSDNNTAAWTTIQDVTVRYNVIRNTQVGAAIASRAAYGTVALVPTQPSQRISLQNNWFDNQHDGNLFVLGGDLQNFSLVHNTADAHGTNLVLFHDAPENGFYMVDNALSHSWGGVFGDYKGEGNAALGAYAPGATVARNILYGYDGWPGYNPDIYPAGNYFAGLVSNVGFTSYSGGDLSLGASSPYKGKASDGTDPGADFVGLRAAIAGVVQP
jgi:uncharacterized protein YjdB